MFNNMQNHGHMPMTWPGGGGNENGEIMFLIGIRRAKTNINTKRAKNVRRGDESIHNVSVWLALDRPPGVSRQTAFNNKVQTHANHRAYAWVCMGLHRRRRQRKRQQSSFGDYRNRLAKSTGHFATFKKKQNSTTCKPWAYAYGFAWRRRQ